MPHQKLYQISPETIFSLSDDVLQSLLKHIQHQPHHPESCGVMIGRELHNGSIIVDMVTEPQETDIQTRFYCKRNEAYHQAEVEKAWHESDGTANYLGEWHTHPEDHPVASFFDRLQWRQLNEKIEIDSNRLFFVIVGRKSISVYMMNRDNAEVRQLASIRRESLPSH